MGHRGKTRNAVRSLLAAYVAFSAPAHAEVLTANGTISKVFVSYANNYAFRIHVQNNGADALPACNLSFAYMNADDDNYQVKVAALLAARAQRQTITLFVERGANNLCQIREFMIESS